MDNTPFEPSLIDALVREDRVHRRLFTDPAIFELEIDKVFHGTWVYVGHEAEIPRNGDFRLSRIGRQPVIVVRDQAGAVRVHFNACRHRGVTVCQDERGHARHFLCAYHGWTYGLDGRFVAVPLIRADSGMFWAQDPPTRTTRLIGNLLVERANEGLLSTCKLVLVTQRRGQSQLLSGTCRSALIEAGESFQIKTKTVLLIQNDEPQLNLTFLP